MDHFGIGAAMQSMARVYSQAARRTGRTTSLVESVKEGDRIVFANQDEARTVVRLLRERELVDVQCLVVDPKTPERLMSEHGTSQGRTLFDHGWVEAYYREAIARAEREIDFFERATSGYGPAHRETRRRAIELSKWR